MTPANRGVIMDLDRISVELRPRNGWQSVDLGFQMARRYFLPLTTLWLCLATPLYLLLKLFSLPGFATLMIWWWFKPFYESPLLFWISRALFSEDVSHRKALRTAIARLPGLLCSYLSIRRFSTSRSQDMSVVILENLAGTQRRDRIAVLNRMATRTFALISMCLHFELILFYGVLILLIAMLPESMDTGHVFSVLFIEDSQGWATTITEVTTLLVGAAVAPFYVCAGFALYINRRTQLEAWDIELEFRRVAFSKQKNRPGNSRTLTVVVMVLTLYSAFSPTDHVYAKTNPAESRIVIDQILDGDDFGSTEIVKRIRLKENIESDEGEEAEPYNTGWIDKAARWIKNIANAMELILWGVFIATLLAIAVAIYRRSDKLQSLIRELGWTPGNTTGSKVFDLDIRPQSLPSDIPSTAKRLARDGKKREAMSLLYRGALSRLVHRHGMIIRQSASEQNCVSLVEKQQPVFRSKTFSDLTSLWQKTAYAQHPPAETDINLICEQWSVAFDGDPRV